MNRIAAHNALLVSLLTPRFIFISEIIREMEGEVGWIDEGEGRKKEGRG